MKHKLHLTYVCVYVWLPRGNVDNAKGVIYMYKCMFL